MKRAGLAEVDESEDELEALTASTAAKRRERSASSALPSDSQTSKRARVNGESTSETNTGMRRGTKLLVS